MYIPISTRDRSSGYFTWEAKEEKEMNRLLHGVDSIVVLFNSVNLGEKKINRKTRRIHIGSAVAIDENAKIYSVVRRKSELIIDTQVTAPIADGRISETKTSA